MIFRQTFRTIVKNLPLIRNVLKQLAKNVLIPLILMAVALATHPTIHKKMFRSSNTTLTISNEEINDIIKIESGLLIKGVLKQLKMKQKNKKDDFSECY